MLGISQSPYLLLRLLNLFCCYITLIFKNYACLFLKQIDDRNQILLLIYDISMQLYNCIKNAIVQFALRRIYSHRSIIYDVVHRTNVGSIPIATVGAIRYMLDIVYVSSCHD